MPVESSTRITLWLPTPTTLPQWYLVDGILTELIRTCHGATMSSDIPPVFDGFWVDSNQRTQQDANILIVADAPVPLGDAALAIYLDRLKPRCQRLFDQDIVWITVHLVNRVATEDYVR